MFEIGIKLPSPSVALTGPTLPKPPIDFLVVDVVVDDDVDPTLAPI